MTIEASRELRKVIRPGGYFALSFGSIVGSGWVLLLGEWLQRAGPIGAVLALLAGGLAMMLVATCIAELAVRLPRAGGEFTYVREGLGPSLAIMVGWFLTLYLVSICAFEGLALSWLLENLVPAIRSPVAYIAIGNPVRYDELIVGWMGAGAIFALNLAGTRSSVLMQRIVTYGFIAVMAGIVAMGGVFGSAANLHPWFAAPSGSSWTAGAAWIFASCAVLLYGFQAAAQSIEERAPEVGLRSVVVAMLLGVAAAAIFYGAVVLAASGAAPWRTVVTAELPAARAFSSLPGGPLLGRVVLVAALFSLLKTWNGVVMMASRLVLAQARAHGLPPSLGRISRRTGAPTAALVFIAGISLIGVAFGRGAIVPIINMATMCVSLATALCMVALLRLRSRSEATPAFTVPGGTPVIVLALALMVGMSLFALTEPWMRSAGRVPIEWLLMGLWLVAGAALAWASRRYVSSADELDM